MELELLEGLFCGWFITAKRMLLVEHNKGFSEYKRACRQIKGSPGRVAALSSEQHASQIFQGVFVHRREKVACPVKYEAHCGSSQ